MVYSFLLAAFYANALQSDGQKTALFDGDLSPDQIHLASDGKTIAISGGTLRGGDWKIFDLAEGKCVVNGMDGQLRCWGAWSVRMSPDNKLVAVGGNYNNFFLADAKTGKLVWNLTNEGHVGVIRDLFFTPDGKSLISIANDMMVRVWDIESKKPHAVFRFTSTNARLNQWQSPLHKERAQLVCNVAGKYNFLQRCGLSPDGKTLAVAGNLDGKVPFLDLDTGKTVKTIDIKRPVAGSVQFTPGGNWLLVAACELNGQNGTVEIWDVQKNKLVTSFDSKGSIHLTLSPDKKTVLSGGADGFRVFDVATGKQKFSYFTKDDPRLPRTKVFPDGSSYVHKECLSAGVAFLPDGKTFLFVPHWTLLAGEIYFHDTATGEPVDYRKRVAALPKIGGSSR